MKIKFFFTGLAFLFILALALVNGNGGNAGNAWANSGSEADEILDAMPDDYPENFSDSDIDELMKDIEDVDESADAEQKKDLFRRGFGRDSGLGLFLTKEILALTGMGIRETSEPGRGGDAGEHPRLFCGWA
ncbi:MAG TPA: hypothetical protein P5346_02830 [Spirochaetota bacterium]|nr:hypothetical protein [Spirochaetota bacterium]